MNRTHILIVEDETHLALSLRMTLSCSGYRVSLVSDEAGAHDLLARSDDAPALLLLDLELASLAGLRLMERVVAEHPGLPVLVVCGFMYADAARSCLAGIRGACLEKPFETRHVLDKIGELLAVDPQARA